MDTVALVPEECAVESCIVSIGEDSVVHVQLVTLETFDTEPLKVRSPAWTKAEKPPSSDVTTVPFPFLAACIPVADS
jgi:hypothetical protein